MFGGIPGKGVKCFDGTNFQGWKSQVSSLFLMSDVLDVVDGTRTMPTGDTAADVVAKKKFKKDDATARFIIMSSLDDARQQGVIACSTAREKWEKLCLVFEQKSTSNRVAMLHRFFSCKMEEGEPAIQFVARIQNMAGQLGDVGTPVDEETVIAKVLSGLAEKYGSFVEAWDSVHPDLQTLENLQQRLIRRDERLGVGESTASALVATEKKKAKRDKKKPKNKNKNKKEVECYRCHELGHYARECKNDRKKRDDDSSSRDCAFVVEEASAGHVAGFVSSEESHNGSDAVKGMMAARVSDVWLTDSGASRHLTFRKEWLTDFREEKDGTTVSLGDNEACEIIGRGNVLIKKLVDGVWCDGVIEDVLYVPKLRKNLFSVGVCTKKGLEVRFRGQTVQVVQDGAVVASGAKQDNDIFRMFFKVLKAGSREEANVASSNLTLWHERLGHVGQKAIRELVKKGLVSGVSLKDESEIFCEPCKMGKSHCQKFERETVKVKTEPGEMFHTDVCGPMSVESPGGAKYFLTFKDDASGYRHVYFLRHKADVFEKFKRFDKLVANKFGRPMKILRSDNGLEFRNRSMDSYLAERGIKKQNTAPYTPQQNGKAERENRTIVESARTMLLAKGLPKSLWAEAVNCAVYVLNRTVWSTGGKTPYEQWIGKVPNIKHLRVFGSEAYAHVPKQFLKKFDARARKMIMVGYEEESGNYRLYDACTKKVSVSRDVTFNESVGAKSSNSRNASGDGEEEGLMLPARDQPNGDERREAAERRENEESEEEGEFEDTRDAREKAGGSGGEERLLETPRTLRNRANIKRPIRFECDVAEYIIPSSYGEATSGSDATQWAEAIRCELESHEQNNTWKLVPRTPGVRTIDSK